MNAELKNKMFYLECFELISFIFSFCEALYVDLKHLNNRNYIEIFKGSIDTIKAVTERIELFVDKWDADDNNICNYLSLVKDYYKYYCIMLGESSSRLYYEDAKYICDSLSTSKIVLINKLKKIKENI